LCGDDLDEISAFLASAMTILVNGRTDSIEKESELRFWSSEV
jgi:hypothetical protein